MTVIDEQREAEGTVFKMRMSTELFAEMVTRTENGDRLSYELGEPDEEGFYTPTITRHSDDNIVVAAVAPFVRLLQSFPGLRAKAVDLVIWDTKRRKLVAE